MDLGPQQIGKWLIVMGIVLVVVGVLFVILGRLGLFRMPGDMEFGGEDWKVYFPIGTCIVLSILLTVILWVIQYFRR